jgi:hypothetical protein
MGQALFRQLTKSETMQFAFWITGEETARHFWVNVDRAFLDDNLPPGRGLSCGLSPVNVPPGSARQRIDHAASKK